MKKRLVDRMRNCEGSLTNYFDPKKETDDFRDSFRVSVLDILTFFYPATGLTSPSLRVAVTLLANRNNFLVKRPARTSPSIIPGPGLSSFADGPCFWFRDDCDALTAKTREDITAFKGETHRDAGSSAKLLCNLWSAFQG